jgi:glycosyltransferase involved in cell wall biosynthesis
MRILTVISNFNEEKAILDTLRDLEENCTIETDILVIDNSSMDNSQQIIKANGVDYLFHPVNTGGSAGVIKTALAYAYYNDYDIYCHMDGDNQHSAAELNKLLKPILEDDKDIVIGSRFIEKEGFQSHFLRRIGINLFSNILTYITKNKLTDITSGFRAYNKKAITFFAQNYKHEMEASVQMLLIASFAKLKITEVPVVMKPRTSGVSELNLVIAIKFPVYGAISLIGTLLQKR